MKGFTLIPRTAPFFDLFQKSADLNSEGARVLSQILAGGVDVERKARELKDIEHRADENTHEIFSLLNVTFVTPLDREDISALASALDDVIDWIEEASRRVRLYQLSEGTPLARRLASIIVEQAEQVVRAVPLLESRRGSTELETANREIHRLENEADDFYADALAHLYDGVIAVPELVRAIRWGDIYAVLETATDKAEHVAVVMHNIALKHG